MRLGSQLAVRRRRAVSNPTARCLLWDSCPAHAAVCHGVAAAVAELRRLGRILKQRAGDMLAYFELLKSSQGRPETVNERLEYRCGSLFGSRNLAGQIAKNCWPGVALDPGYTPDGKN